MLLFGSEEEDGDFKLAYVFYGAANALGYGIGAVLVSPKGMQYPIAVKLTFPCTTSQSMKSALLGWLQAALEMKIRNLEVYGPDYL